MLHKDLTGADLHIPKVHTHVKADITDFPILIPGTGNGDVVGPVSATSGNMATYADETGKSIQDGGAVPTTLPASDVSAWAKNATKPAYASSEITNISAAGQALIDDASATVQIATLGLDPDIATLALPANTTISAAGAELVNDANAAAQLATLGAAAAADVALNTLLALATARHGALTNLITNGEFETNTAGWGGDATLTRDTATPLVGTGSLKVASVTNTSHCYFVIAGATVGHHYYIRGLVKTSSAGKIAHAADFTAGVGPSADCGTTAQWLAYTYTATGATLYAGFAMDAYVGGDSMLVDSVVCYDLTAALESTINPVYSEGTWTPTLYHFTLVGTDPPVSGTWKRIGKLVFAECVISAGTGGNTSVACTTNDSRFYGLPTAPIINAPCMATVKAAAFSTAVGVITTDGEFFPASFAATSVPIFITATYLV